MDKMIDKRCTECNEIKNVTEFHKNKNGLCGKCKTCRNKRNREYSKIKSVVEHKKKYYKSGKKLEKFLMPSKICSKCNLVRPTDCFSYSSHGTDYPSQVCIVCRPKYRNKDAVKTYNAMYYAKHKNHIIENAVNNNRKRLQNNIQYKLANNLRGRLKKAIANNYKAGSAVRDLGCSIKELKIYLENQFYTNSETGMEMGWDNYGKWHIDHIKPLSSFDLTDREQFLQACNYTNLQPLWAKDNLRKGCKYY